MGSDLGVSLTLPSAALFRIPSRSPAILPPPPAGSSPGAPPFNVPAHIYQTALDPRVPLTIATVYAVTAKALNSYNRSTGKKPWAISKTRGFHWFVVAHNIFLAVYSAWTWWGMFGALRRSAASPLGPGGLVAFTDSMCRMNGPAGLGRGAFFDDAAGAWRTHAHEDAEAVLTGAGMTPSPYDAGRMWNEGLAFYGWIFYLSKFYEVLDTLIILAKGKLSSTLQTYHHAGAMMCMWAGMRYMSPPIWVFCFVNSFIHALMYSYYTLSAFKIRVPVGFKRALTSMQITQFVMGASIAMLHSFVSYNVPVTVEQVRKVITASSNNTTGAHAIVTGAGSALFSGLKGLLLGSGSQRVAAPAAAVRSVKDTTTTFAQQTVPCITTSGSTFAIWLNVLYLAPLTYLFAKFFVASYLRRSNADYKTAVKGRRLSNEAILAEKAGWDAARDVEREMYGQEGAADEAVVLTVDGKVKRSALTTISGKSNNRMTKKRA